MTTVKMLRSLGKNHPVGVDREREGLDPLVEGIEVEVRDDEADRLCADGLAERVN